MSKVVEVENDAKQLKKFTRGQPMTRELMQGFIAALDLPESEKNRDLGMFGVMVELRSSNGTLLASSLRSTRFPHESHWIATVRKAVCIVPLMLGAVSESRRVLVPTYRFFVESEALPLVRCEFVMQCQESRPILI